MNPFLIIATGYGIYKLLSEEKILEVNADETINTHKLLNEFYDNHVKLSSDRWKELKGHGTATLNRIVKGLEEQDKPLPCEHVLQGSFGMKTVTQAHPDTDEHYDIDLGLVFKNEELFGPQGGEMSPLDVRTMVFDALGKDDRFTKEPEKKENCVRVNYSGHHVDVPSYRHAKDHDEAPYELASSNWKSSSPREVTERFDKAVKLKSPENDKQQLRTTVQLMKYFSKSRSSWNAPSGLIISKLVVDAFPEGGFPGRDDIALFFTMIAIHEMLEDSLEVKHPVLDEYITKTDCDPCMVEFKEHLRKAIDDLKVLSEDDVTPVAAKKAWGKVFRHDFFNQEDVSVESGLGLGLASSVPTSAVSRNAGDNRYG